MPKSVLCEYNGSAGSGNYPHPLQRIEFRFSKIAVAKPNAATAIFIV